MKKKILFLTALALSTAYIAVGCGGDDDSTGPPPMVCDPATCPQYACSVAACMVPRGSTTAVCEYAPKLTGTCRCHVGDRRPCGSAKKGWKICSAATGNVSDTDWGACSITGT
jgi:hypothetical protein